MFFGGDFHTQKSVNQYNQWFTLTKCRTRWAEKLKPFVPFVLFVVYIEMGMAVGNRRHGQSHPSDGTLTAVSTSAV